jgi:hypothetical protein
MRGDSSGLLETIAAGLCCIVALAAIYREDGDALVCRPERVAVVLQPAASFVRPADAKMAAEIRDMLLHD